MGMEIERKFLPQDERWRAAVTGSQRMRQGYLLDPGPTPGAGGAAVRIRMTDTQAWLTIKQAVAGVSRAEFEYPIPLADAGSMLASLCGPILEKTRHRVRVGTTLFEVDEFAGANAGLVVAEVELPATDAPFARPEWLGPEVSHLHRYYNVALVTHPYASWSALERAAGDATC